jgi:heat shock protein HslJ
MRNVKELHKYFFGCANIAPISSAICSKSFTMKLISFVGTGAFIFFSAFVMKKETDKQLSSLYDTKWQLKQIHIADSVELVTGKAFIKFNQAKKSAGGNGSCNAFGSSITVSGNTVSFKDIFSTKMYCEGVQQTEDTFFKQLGKVNRFMINGKALLLYNDKEVLLEFEKE